MANNERLVRKEKLAAEFETAKRSYGVHYMAELLARVCGDILAECEQSGGLSNEYRKMLDSVDALLAASIDDLGRKRYGASARSLEAWIALRRITNGVWWRECGKYRGIQRYGLGNFDEAESLLREYVQFQPQDEYGLFYLAGSMFRQGKHMEAAVLYERLLAVDSTLDEAISDLALTFLMLQKQQPDGLGVEILANVPAEKVFADFLPLRRLPHLSAVDCKKLPIFINSRDRVLSLRRLVDWLINAGYRNINIVDNASTYEPLLNYYRELGAQGIRVLRLDQNIGHKALWLAKILQRLKIDTPYVYTDSDVVPVEDCPDDVVFRLYEVLERYPYLDKVGLGIVTENLTAPDAARIKREQESFYHVPLEDNVYFHPHDTTFALYRPNKAYRLCSAARTLSNLRVYHLPWHYDYANLSPDEIYYMKHANSSSNQAQDYLKYVSGAKTEG